MHETDMGLYEKLLKLQGLLQRQRMSRMMGHSPLSDAARGQGRVLAILKIQPEITAKNLAYLLGIRQQSLNELLNKMEKGGYVERRPSEADRRIIMIHLTERGRAVQQLEAVDSDIFDCLNPEERATFGAYLDRITTSLKEKLKLGVEMSEWAERVRASIGDEGFEHLVRMRDRWMD